MLILIYSMCILLAAIKTIQSRKTAPIIILLHCCLYTQLAIIFKLKLNYWVIDFTARHQMVVECVK